MRAVLLLGVLGTTALAWLATAELPGAARGLATFLVAPFPALLVLQAGAVRAQHEPPDRMPAYLGSILTLALLAVGTFFVARDGGFAPAWLGLTLPPMRQLLLWSAGVTAIGVAVQLAGTRLRIRESEILLHLLPRTAPERAVFVVLSAVAGVGEELVFRGFLISALHLATGSLTIAVMASAGAFGVMHAYQNPRGAARAAALGLLLTAPVLATGSIIPSMIAHTLLDWVGGLWIGRRLVRE